MRDERGSLTAFMAVFAVALFALVGLVVDGGRALAAHERAWTIAQQAARLGAAQIDVGDLRAGMVTLDPASAQAAVQSYLSAHGYAGSVIVGTDRVEVTVSASEPTVVLGVIGVGHISIVATAAAVDVHGVTTED